MTGNGYRGFVGVPEEVKKRVFFENQKRGEGKAKKKVSGRDPGHGNVSLREGSQQASKSEKEESGSKNRKVDLFWEFLG